MDTQETGAATGLFGLSLDTLKLSIADYTQLCGLWMGRVRFLSDRYLKDSEDVTHGDDLEAGKLAGAVSWLYPVDCWQARRVVGTLAKHEAAFESLLTAVQTFEHVQSRVSLTWQVRMEHEKDGR